MVSFIAITARTPSTLFAAIAEPIPAPIQVLTGAGYTAGGATLGTPTLTYTAGTNVLMLDGADVSWATSTITARYAVIYDSTPATDATRALIAYVDFGADVVSTGGSFDLVWNAAGIATVTVA